MVARSFLTLSRKNSITEPLNDMTAGLANCASISLPSLQSMTNCIQRPALHKDYDWMVTPRPLIASTLPLLSMTRSPSLAEQAADAIVTGISSGILKPGQRLVETELAGTLKMSRVPLREALKILEAQGIVESIPHRGTRTAVFNDDRVDQICEARIALEKL